MPEKIDGVIDAVRYRNGQIVMVRAYERRGATFSDQTLIDRKTLLGLLNNKRRFVTGTRKEFQASTFSTGKAVQAIEQDGRVVISTHASATGDELEGVPVF